MSNFCHTRISPLIFPPQILAATAKNFIIFNLGEFTAFSAIVIPSLIGLASELNPDETVRIDGAQTSWLGESINFLVVFHHFRRCVLLCVYFSATCAYIAQPIGALLSGPLSDRIGRRKTLLLLTIPLTITWIVLGFAQSFPLICVGFTLIGFCMGLKETPAITYVSEISEPSIRGAMITMALLSHQAGFLVVFGFGMLFSWRQVALICALFPFSCFVTVLFVSPLLSMIDCFFFQLEFLRIANFWVFPPSATGSRITVMAAVSKES